MRTRLALAAVLTVVAAACASPDAAPDTTSAPVSTTPVPTTSNVVTTDSQTTTQPVTDEDTATTRPPPNPDRDLAPDFSLILSDGTEYRLADEVRPVYLVFWAEW